MSESYRWLAGNPAAQPFSIKGSPCRSKKNSWWNAASSKFWRNGNTSKGTSRQPSDQE